jgi:hypothetical protein
MRSRRSVSEIDDEHPVVHGARLTARRSRRPHTTSAPEDALVSGRLRDDDGQRVGAVAPVLDGAPAEPAARLPTETRTGIQLPCAVEIVARDGHDCKGDAQLAGLVVTDGPAAFEINSARANLIEDEALEQTVALVKRVDTGELLGFANVRYHEPFQEHVPPWLVGLRSKPYIGVLARDDRYFKCKLADGETWLGAALVRSVIEIHTPLGEPPEKFWAFTKRNNRWPRRAFRANDFQRHPRSAEHPEDILVRQAGVDLRPPPGPDVYIPPPRPIPVPIHTLGRNDPCWCDSGKKFKKCHGR